MASKIVPLPETNTATRTRSRYLPDVTPKNEPDAPEEAD
jgi:hypothetical protein